MLRRILTILSLLLMLAAITLWVRSHWIEDFVAYNRKGIGSLAAWSRDGRLSFWRDRYEEALVLRQRPVGWEYETNPMKKPGRWPDGNPGRLGFVFERDSRGQDLYRALAIPWWAVAGLFALPPALYLWGWSKRRVERRLGLCAVCGYDLRASSGRCPECGTAIPQSRPTTTARAVLTPAG